MKGKRITLIVLSLLTLFALTPVASAFSDIKGKKGERHIVHLKDRGVIKGDAKGKGHFRPQDKLTYAQAAVLLDDAFDLNLAAISFVKAPKASDYYKHAKDKTWYSQALIDGYHNGVVFPADMKPNSPISREEFAAMLMRQVDQKVDYALIMMHLDYNDIDEGKEEYKGEIQKLLLLKFAELDKKNKFYPTKAITREDAAIWLDMALTFIDEQLDLQEKPEPSALQDVKLTLTKVNDDVNKATISATVPHPGYGIEVTSIEFIDKTAYITVKHVDPDPNRMYPQVISNVSVDTYVSSAYKVEVKKP